MRCLLSIAILLTLSSAAYASEYRGGCDITFKGSSTLHDIHGTGKCQPFTASSRDGALEISQVAVAVSSLDTDNSRRDKKMREMFEENRHPLITGGPGGVALREIRSAKEGARVSFPLKIRDIVRPVTGTVTKFTESDTRITADVTFTLSLAEYDLKPPSVIGLIRVDDKVSVTATMFLDVK